MIIPTKRADVPVVPNFYLEAKAPGGGAEAVRRQACLEGAYGARAMHILRSYGEEEEPVYDSKAYTYSSTYHAGTLRLYAHHVTAPTTSGGGNGAGVHMTQVKGFDMLSDRDACADGIKHFRNARDLAQRHRDEFIQDANARARRSDTLPLDEPEAAEARPYRDSGSDDFVDCEEYVASRGVATKVSSLPQYLSAKDEEHSQESTSLGAVEPAMSFATSFTSSFSTQSPARSKRNRVSRSPPTESKLLKKQNVGKKRVRHGAS